MNRPGRRSGIAAYVVAPRTRRTWSGAISGEASASCTPRRRWHDDRRWLGLARTTAVAARMPGDDRPGRVDCAHPAFARSGGDRGLPPVPALALRGRCRSDSSGGAGAILFYHRGRRFPQPLGREARAGVQTDSNCVAHPGTAHSEPVSPWRRSECHLLRNNGSPRWVAAVRPGRPAIPGHNQASHCAITARPRA
jgi:hypothetical protein